MASVFWWLVRPGSSGNPMVLSPRLCRQKAVEALTLWLFPTVPCLLELTWVLPGQGSRVIALGKEEGSGVECWLCG